MKEILDMYSKGSGQLINQDKRSLFFINTLEERQRKIAQIFGCGVGKFPSTYLGLPLGMTPPNSFYNGIMNRFSKKLVGQKGASLSQVDKCQLVKSTLKNLPVYTQSLFGILVNFFERMDKI